jgi:hypothetical protein
VQQLALHRRLVEQNQVFISSAPDGPTDQAQTAYWTLCLRGGCSQGVRLCSCAGTRTSCQAQLSWRDNQRAACDTGRGAEAAQQLAHYIGVSWHKATSSWYAQVYNPQAKRGRSVGYFGSEEDAARAYDFAAVQAHGPGAKRNFPDEAISELPATVGEKRKQRSSNTRVSAGTRPPLHGT